MLQSGQGPGSLPLTQPREELVARDCEPEPGFIYRFLGPAWVKPTPARDIGFIRGCGWTAVVDEEVSLHEEGGMARAHSQNYEACPARIDGA